MSSNIKVSNHKCPFCENTQAFKYTTTNGNWMFLCHDCQRNVRFDSLPIETRTNHTQITFNSLLGLCIKFTDLPEDHLCVEYVKQRRIPQEHHKDLYFVDSLDEVVKVVGKSCPPGPRLVLPFFNEDGKMFALQGRALDNTEPRYITIVFDEEEDLVFGRDKVDYTKDFVVVEGPIDSLFLQNAIATAGVGNLADKYKPNAILCLDNEPRNKEIVRLVKKNLERGFKVVIWPSEIKQKDINEMFVSGIDVKRIIFENVFSGMVGLLKMNSWKRM